jgi:hypothetical protein
MNYHETKPAWEKGIELYTERQFGRMSGSVGAEKASQLAHKRTARLLDEYGSLHQAFVHEGTGAFKPFSPTGRAKRG